MTERRILSRPYTFEDAKMNDVLDMIFIELGRIYRGNFKKYVELRNVRSIDTDTLIVAGTNIAEDELAFLSGLDQKLGKAEDVIFNDITVTTPSNIYALSHDSFANFEADEHVAHSGTNLVKQIAPRIMVQNGNVVCNNGEVVFV